MSKVKVEASINNECEKWADYLLGLMKTSRPSEELSAVGIDELVEFAFQQARREIIANGNAIAERFNKLSAEQPGDQTFPLAAFKKDVPSFAIIKIVL